MGREEDLGFHPFELDEEKIRGWNLDVGTTVLATGTTEPESKIQLSIQLLERLNNQRTLRKGRDTHLRKRSGLIPDSEIKSMAMSMLAGCETAPPPELLRLVAALLGVQGRRNTGTRSRWARRDASRYVAEHPDASDRQVARVVGVSPHTVKKWRTDKYFTERVKALMEVKRAGGIIL